MKKCYLCKNRIKYEGLFGELGLTEIMKNKKERHMHTTCLILLKEGKTKKEIARSYRMSRRT